MCMEDVKIGRASTSRTLVFNAGVAAQQVLPNSDSRIALSLGAPLSGTITYLDQANVVSGQGINVAAGQVPVQLDIQSDGDIVRHQWWAIGSGAGIGGGLIETILPAGFNG